MNQTFVRCPHCGLPHEHDQRVCPATGLALGRSREPPRGTIPAVPAIPRAPAAGAGGEPEGPGRRQIVGRVIGDKYGVTGLIGEGGMGAVYEAEHLQIGRLVAVKVLHPKHAQKREAISRLHHEARVVGTIGHPNICEVYDIGRLDDGSPYLVMERLQGETLAERIQREGQVGQAELIDVLVQVLSALVVAHDKGVVHRDLKPDNIFLSHRAGMPPIAKLLDFGISKASNVDDTAVNLTRTGMVMGTPYYMAPEQARGDRTLDHRVDLWAVGVVLYEALTGRRPFVARNYNALLVQILTSRHRPVIEYKREVAPGLSEAIDRALSKMREDRFQSAAEFQAALLRYRRPSTVPMSGAAAEREGAGPWGRRASDRMAAPDDGRSGPDPAAQAGEAAAAVAAVAAPTRVFQEDATIVLGELPPGDDDTPVYPPPLMDEEDAERTVVDPPSFLTDSITIVARRPPVGKK